MAQIKTNGNTLEHGDEVLYISSYNSRTLKGKLSIDLNRNVVYICHEDSYFEGDTAPEMFGYKYSYKISTYSPEINLGSQLLFNAVDLDILFTNLDKILKTSVRNFIYSISYEVYFLFSLKLGVIDMYDSITESAQQGYVDLHSSTRGKKMSIKLGRLVKKLSTAFNDRITKNAKNTPFIVADDVIEKLHNRWMGTHESAIISKILNGNDILKGYTKENYGAKRGTLHQSCMGDKYDYLNLYTENPDKISLMVFSSIEEPDKIIGRCLLWKCDDGVEYHDRIYYTEDWLEYSFNSICVKQGYQKIYTTTTDASISLSKLDFLLYPYLDTFYSVSFKKKRLYYNPSGNKKIKYLFQTTTGQITERDMSDIDAE